MTPVVSNRPSSRPTFSESAMFTLCLMACVWGVRHIDDTRGLYVTLISVVPLFKVSRDWLRRF